jgi:hypothetical protein
MASRLLIYLPHGNLFAGPTACSSTGGGHLARARLAVSRIPFHYPKQGDGTAVIARV